MLERMPEYKKLSEDEKTALLRRMIKVYAGNPHPHRAAALRVELKKQMEEVKQKGS